MGRYRSPALVLVALFVVLFVTFAPLSQEQQEQNPDYTYRYGCPVWEQEQKSYCPERYDSLTTSKDRYDAGEEVVITLMDLRDFEHKVDKVEVHFKPLFEHDYELIYTDRDVDTIPRSADEWSWSWPGINDAGQQVGAGRGYIRLTLNCCKNYRAYFRMSRGGGSEEEVSPPQEPELTVPGSPGNLTGRSVSSTEIRLTWNDNSDDEEGFRIYRNGMEIAELNPNTTRYVDSDLTAGESYTYRVSSFNQDGESPLSSELSLTTPMETPEAPGRLRAEAISPTEIALSWRDNSDNEAGFRIYRNGNRITTIDPNRTDYTDTGLQEDTRYTYRVAAFNESGESSSEPSSRMTSMGKPEGPGELSSEALSPERIRLRWRDNSDNEDGFRVYRNGELVAELNPNTTVYTDSGLSGGTSYNYRISSFNQSGETFAPYELDRETPVGIPKSPVQLVAKARSPKRIEITWQDNSDNEDGYRVYRNGAIKATIEANVTSYLDTGLDGGTNYSYRVSAYNDGGESPKTSRISATTPVEVPTPPRRLASESLSPTEIRLSWRDTSENEAGFRVYRNGNQIASLDPNTSKYVDSDLNPDTAYNYRVTSYNESGESTFTSSLDVNTPKEIPSSPARLRTEAASPSSVRLRWDDESDNENGFRVYRNGNRIAAVEEDTTVYLHDGLKGERRYCYEVVAFNESGESETTNRNCAMTPPSVPDAPGNLKASPQSPRRIRLSWDDSSNNEEGFRVYRNGVEIATLEPNKTSYLDTELSPERSYSYEVSAFNSSGESRLTGSGQVNTPKTEPEEPEIEPEKEEVEEPSVGRASLLAGIGIVIMVMGYIYSEMG